MIVLKSPSRFSCFFLVINCVSLLLFQDEANNFLAGVWNCSELLSGSGIRRPASHCLILISVYILYFSCHQQISHAAIFMNLVQMDTGGEETGGEEEHVELFTTPRTKMGAATSDFGYNLFRALASRESTGNVFLAPISVSAALTQLSLGDDTNTLQPKSKLVIWF